MKQAMNVNMSKKGKMKAEKYPNNKVSKYITERHDTCNNNLIKIYYFSKQKIKYCLFKIGINPILDYFL